MTGKKILLVDDEPDIREFLSYTLRKEGFDVITASNGKSGVEKAREHIPDIILLDVMMPGMDGIEACEQIRELPSLEDVIICFLTARSEDYSQIAGLEAGGDDYIIKPVKPKLLVSRIKALLRRSRNNEKRNKVILTCGNISLDRERFLVNTGENEVILPRKEFDLLALLISKPGKVFSRSEIFRNVWGDNIIVGDRTIDVHIRKLREKIGNLHIQTIKGVGYKFNE